MTNTYLDGESLAVLSGLVGTQVHGYGTHLDVEEGVGAFGAWVRTELGYVQLEYVETVIDFAAGERVESVLRVSPPTQSSPGGDEYELAGQLTAFARIQDGITQIGMPAGEQEWQWWRDSGIRFTLGNGQELLIHCASPVTIEVVMQAGPVGTLEPRTAGRVYQEGEKRRYVYERREVPLEI